MNAHTSLRRRSLTTVVATVCIVFSIVAAAAASADSPAPRTPTLEATVLLSDLDLSTPAGVRAAHKRLRKKAESLCRQLWDSASATYRWTYAACVQATLADAVRQLDAQALAANQRPLVRP